MLAQWLLTRPRVLILDEPTRGVDIGAKSEIYRIIRELAAQGAAILLVSSELPEVLGLADRIAVMAEGRAAGFGAARRPDAGTRHGPCNGNPSMTQTTDPDIHATRHQLRAALHQYGGILVSLVVLCVIFSVMNERFMTIANLTNILQQVAVVAIAAFGMTWVILLGEIDLSIGSIIAVAGLAYT
nr:hypothetical protein [Paracoccus mutanolyticus]